MAMNKLSLFIAMQIYYSSLASFENTINNKKLYKKKSLEIISIIYWLKIWIQIQQDVFSARYLNSH